MLSIEHVKILKKQCKRNGIDNLFISKIGKQIFNHYLKTHHIQFDVFISLLNETEFQYSFLNLRFHLH